MLYDITITFEGGYQEKFVCSEFSVQRSHAGELTGVEYVVADKKRSLYMRLSSVICITSKRAKDAESDLSALAEIVHALRQSGPKTATPEDAMTLGPKLRAMGPELRALREKHGIRLADLCRATDAHAGSVATIELGLEPQWDILYSAEEAERKAAMVPPDSELHVSLRNVVLDEKLRAAKTSLRRCSEIASGRLPGVEPTADEAIAVALVGKLGDLTERLTLRAAEAERRLEQAHSDIRKAQAIHKVLAENGRETTADSVHALTVEARKARDAVIERDAANLARHEAEKAAAELGAQLQALKVNPCSTCVRERDAARAERDEARRQGDVNFQELERQRRRAADLQAAHVASEKCIAEYRALVAKHEGDIKHIVSAYHDVGGANPASAATVAGHLRNLSKRLYGERVSFLAEACNEAMPHGYKLVIETDEHGTWHRWQTHDTSGTRWTNPVAVLAEAWGVTSGLTCQP